MKLYISGFKFAELALSKQLTSWLFIDNYIVTFPSLLAEVVLSLLIESFEFTPSKKEIFWQLSKLVMPIVVGEGARPQLPVMVESVHREKHNFELGWFEVCTLVPILTWYVYVTVEGILSCMMIELMLLHCGYIRAPVATVYIVVVKSAWSSVLCRLKLGRKKSLPCVHVSGSL